MKPEGPIILLIEAHRSHIIPRVIAYTGSQRIILIELVADSSFVDQPLDLWLSGLFKNLYQTEPKTKNSEMKH
jgi:hypothetical protein